MPSRNAVVVSLHDVSPLTWGACRRILAELTRIHASPVSLLVIPDHHGRGNFADNSAFCEWMTGRIAQGDEAVLHGYRHRQLQPSPGSLIVAPGFSDFYFGDEAEFVAIAYETARTLAARGLESFQRIGLVPKGFIAPAWLLGGNAQRAIRDLGFHYTALVNGVRDFQTDSFYPSRSLCWSTRAAWRRVLSLIWNALLMRRMTSEPLLRIAIHPPDIDHPRIWRQISWLTAQAVKRRMLRTYESWLASRETQDGADS